MPSPLVSLQVKTLAVAAPSTARYVGGAANYRLKDGEGQRDHWCPKGRRRIYAELHGAILGPPNGLEMSRPASQG